MNRIGDVPEIQLISSQLRELQKTGAIQAWEAPCTRILTRRSAALYFITAMSEEMEALIWDTLKVHEGFGYQLNQYPDISSLKWCITFNNDPANS
ncbi:hypothetical protein [Chitinophaga sp.]|uniref:hypothetical protein n=1 Tax=Chitinophaga sp. TaxID=1869181 RepID=UPI002D14B416|nr:hypothetical protein [Chitinophaga sp.]HWV68409.1 hypothetical protein [Chitinophaga sp.]